MPINFKDYTPIPWRAPATLTGTGTPTISPTEPTPNASVTSGLTHPHHHRLKKIFHLSHKLHLKFL